MPLSRVAQAGVCPGLTARYSATFVAGGTEAVGIDPLTLHLAWRRAVAARPQGIQELTHLRRVVLRDRHEHVEHLANGSTFVRVLREVDGLKRLADQEELDLVRD